MNERAEDPVHSRLRQARLESGMSRREVADALGIHYQTVGYLERGEYSPSLALALRMAELFELPLEQLFSLKPFPRIGEAERSA